MQYEKIAKIDDEAVMMIKKDVDEAFFLFGLKYKRYPTYQTAHNLGTFLSKYGRETSFFSRRTMHLAKALLLEAKNQEGSFITLKELGDLYLDSKKYKLAVVSYNNALKQKTTYATCYNLALCYYYLKDFQNMKLHLQRFLNNAEFSDDESANLTELLAFAYAFTGNSELAKRNLYLLQENKSYANTPETLKLAYLCDDLSFILNHYKAVFSNWMFEFVSFQIVYQAFYRTQNQSLDKFENLFRQEVETFYSENPDFDQTDKDKLLEQIDSKEYIPNIELTLSPVFSCDFY